MSTTPWQPRHTARSRREAVGVIGNRADVLARMPPHIREACTPLEIYRRVHGIEPDEWSCPECGTVVELHHYPSPGCVGCGRPYPRRCTGLPGFPGCGAVVEPVKWKRPKGWSEPPQACEGCTNQSERRGRALDFHRAVPKERGLHDAAIRAYHALPGRRAFDSAARDYIMGTRREPVLYVLGPPGVGKTTGVARIAHRMYVDEQRAQTFSWVREQDLVRAHVEYYSKDLSVQAAASELLHKAKSAHLLVVDEVWSRTLTDAGQQFLADFWYHRLSNECLWTIAVSNYPPKFIELGPHIESRFMGLGRVVVVEAP
jgi:DNA replication protein DnaC